jgi:hypothetical protein
MVIEADAQSQIRSEQTGDEMRHWSRWDTLALLLFGATVALELIWHDPWADEAQAWLIARSMGFWQIIRHGVRYESSPALWHCFLHLLILLHVSYSGMAWVTGAMAVAGITIFLRWSPFPPVLRVLLPLTFWLAYQDAVIARSYVLFTPLGFAAAALLRNRVRRPILIAVILALCTNLSLHGLVAAFGLAVIVGVQAGRKHRLRNASRLWRRPAWIVAGLILAASTALAVYSAFPPPDDSSPTAENLARSMEKITAKLHGRRLPAAGRLSHPVNMRPDQLVRMPYPRHHRTPLESLQAEMGRALGAITFPLSDVGLYGLLLFGALCWLAFRTPAMERLGTAGAGPLGLPGLVPYLSLVIVFSRMYLAPRHCGMMMMGFLISLWLVWPASSQPPTRALKIITTLLIVMSVEQIGWTAHALLASRETPSDPGVATAAYLRQYPEATVDGFYYHSVDVLPYFSHNIYTNQSSPYWLWSKRPHTDPDAPSAIAKHPDVIVVGGFTWSRHNSAVDDDWNKPDASLNSIPDEDSYRIVPYAEAHGYRITHVFCGDQFMRFGYSEQACNIILQPAAATQ